MRLIGHKGADAIAPGNTLESFAAAVEVGVDMIEIDVLRPRSDFERAADWTAAAAGPVASPSGPLLVAHDWGDARRRDPLQLDAVLDAFLAPPLDQVQVNVDLKVAGREDEVAAALRERDLIERASISTQEVGSLIEFRRLEPELRIGWTLPRTTKDWNSKLWAKPLIVGALVTLRRRLPGVVRRRAPELGVGALWAYHLAISERLLAACREVGIELIAWTVDDAERMRELAELGVDGICTNDPRLFADLGLVTQVSGRPGTRSTPRASK
jgi:glycerophosphoryl diester phosphodiesterase